MSKEKGPIDIMNSTVEETGQTDKTSTENVVEETKEAKVYTEDEYQALYNKYLMACADFDNYIKRTKADMQYLSKVGGKKFFESLIPALNTVYASVKNSDDEGPSLIFKAIKDSLKSANAEIVIPIIGEQFNGDIMHAIAVVPAPDESADNTVVDIMSPGYKIGDEYIQYPKVVVHQS